MINLDTVCLKLEQQQPLGDKELNFVTKLIKHFQRIDTQLKHGMSESWTLELLPQPEDSK